MPAGLVTTWLEEKGFGFIAPDDSNLGDLFVHVSELRDARANGLERGDRVRFDVKYNREKGKNLAVNVIVEKSGASSTRKRNKEDSRARGGHRGKRGRSRSRDSREPRRRSSSRSRRRSRSHGRNKRDAAGSGRKKSPRSASSSSRSTS
eukprot:symbB.v1.2.036234.t1/scaffold5005.1/size31866/2